MGEKDKPRGSQESFFGVQSSERDVGLKQKCKLPRIYCIVVFYFI